MASSITKNKLQTLDKFLSESRLAAIVVHTHPDGDALGSGVAMQHYLSEVRGIDASLIIPDKAPSSMEFLTQGEKIIDAEKSPSEARKLLSDCDLLIVQDMNAFNRAEGIEDALKDCKAEHKVLIDHHLNPDLDSFDLAFSQNDISSACEMLYYTLKGLGKPIPERTAFALFTGMTTDTNNFANSVYPTTLSMASDLLQAGVDRDFILDRLYHSHRRQRLEAFSDMLHNHLTILPNGIAYMIMTSEMFDAYDLDEGETEGLVNIPLEIDEVKICIFLKEAKGLGHYRVSIRAKKGWSANRIAKECFSGGGHELAAGGKLWFPQDISSKSDADAYIKGIAAR